MKGQNSLFTGGNPEDGEFTYSSWKERSTQEQTEGQKLNQILGYEVDVAGYVERTTPYLEMDYQGEEAMNWRRFAVRLYHQRQEEISRIPADSPWHSFSRLPLLQEWLLQAIEKDNIDGIKSVLAYGVEEQARYLVLAE